MISFRPAARTEVGLVRAHNEDAAYAGPLALVVADGMGGHAAGEVASAVSVRRAALALAGGAADPADALREVLDDAHEELRSMVAQDAALTGTSTTFTALACVEDRVVLGHLGDSRAYRWRDGALVQLSHDHTWVQTMLDAGRLTPRQARDSHQRHLVMRCLGGQRPPQPDVLDVDVVAGDRVLVCSDGLTDLVEDHDVARLLAVPDAEEAVTGLVGAALQAGGLDNVTCLVADVADVADAGVPETGPGLLGTAQGSSG